MSYYPLFEDRDLDYDYEFNARLDYQRELEAEHFDYFLQDELDARAEADWAAEADRDGRDAWADIDY
jgi:hypothetical protein